MSIFYQDRAIAIIGMGCRFPGANNVAEFWHLLCNGIDATSEVPPDHFDVDTFYDPRPGIPGRTYTKRGGFLKDVDKFDSCFFGISPRDANNIDPQHRWVLETAWQCVEDAGVTSPELARSRTGVFVGLCTGDYEALGRDPGAFVDLRFAMGVTRANVAGRLSYLLGLTGPSLCLDTACSSSLVAIHLAVRSIRAGECDMALAGGVNAILNPAIMIAFSQGGLLSPDGRCKAFDQSANGFARSEGAGIILMKPLQKALADGDRIYAVIRGSATNNDGPASLFMAPSRPGQEGVLRDACADAKLDPVEIQYVESHGTGTPTGDPIEIETLAAVMGHGRPTDSPLYVGAVKTNIGHLEGGAGVAGVIKTALILRNGIIPPNLHLRNPNPAIAWNQLPIVLPTQVTPWPEGKPKLAGVSSFGISGTNAHAILEAAPPVVDHQRTGHPAQPRLLSISARDSHSLRESAVRWKQYLGTTGEDLRNICHTAALRRNHFEHRLTIAGSTPCEIEDAISSWIQNEKRIGVASDSVTGTEWRKPVFVFSGVGSQWAGMALDLRESYPVFRTALERAEDLIAQLGGWSLLEELRRGEDTTRFGRIDIFQPASVAVQIGLAELWRSWGIEPGLVIGHSVGEVPAAYLAGALSFEQAMSIAVARSEVMHRAANTGSMLACELSREQAEILLQGLEERVSVGVINGRTAVVLSGDTAVLNSIAHNLERKDIFCRKVRMPVPSHSPLMDPLLDDLRHKVEGIHAATARIPILSTVDNHIHYGEALTPDYWVRNLRDTVHFAGAVELALNRGENVFIEVSPHAMLTHLVAKAAAASGVPCLALPSMRRGEDGRLVMLESLGKLHCNGYPVDWRLQQPDGVRHVDIPGHPLRPERFWLDLQQNPHALGRRPGSHMMLADSFEPADQPGTHVWELTLSIDLFPFLGEHSFQTHAVLPAAVYCELMNAAAGSVYGQGSKVFRNIALHRSLFLDKETSAKLQIVMRPPDGGNVAIKFYVQSGAAQGPKTWELSAEALFSADDRSTPQVDGAFDSDVVRERLPVHLSKDEFYKLTIESGIEYGPTFRLIDDIWTDERTETLGMVHMPEFLSAELRRYGVHPAVLDNLLQTTLVPLGGRAGREPVMPYFIEELRIAEQCARPEFWIHARHSEPPPNELGKHDLDAIAPDGEVLISIRGIKSKLLARRENSNGSPEWTRWIYNVRWERIASSPADVGVGSWLIFDSADSLGHEVQDCLEPFGQHAVIAPADWKDDVAGLLRDFGDACKSRWRGVLYLEGLDTPRDAGVVSQQRILGGLLQLVQNAEHIGTAHSPRLFVVTRGAQAIADGAPVHPNQGSLLGFVRSAAIELPGLAPALIDLDPEDSKAPEELAREILSASAEREVVLRGNDRFVPRLARLDPEGLPRRTKTARVSANSPDSYRVRTDSPGMLDKIGLEHCPRRGPAEDEIELRVAAAGLNFLDVLRSLNMYPGQEPGEVAFGMECAGEVVRVGSGVSEFKPGDRVVALPNPNAGCFQVYLTVPARQVFSLPEGLTFEQGATIPVAYQTAWYAISRLGRLRRGESILIHAGAGGVGLAAIAISKYLGLEIFATAGSEEKREYLRRLGVQHVMDSRSLAFAEEVMQITAGRGVDAVLNSIAGDAIAKSLSILAPGGRFLEIGKRDIYANTALGLYPFRKNLSYFAIDMLGLSIENPALIEDLTRELFEHVAAGHFGPLPCTSFAASQAADAFRTMAQAKHIGKVVLTFAENEAETELPLSRLIRRDATYLITGGLTGLGLECARWLSRQGAGALLLIGRRGPDENARDAIAAMEVFGTRVIVKAADVSDIGQLNSVLHQITLDMPPIGGVIHAAGVLRDAIVQNLTWDDFHAVLAPKVQGAWNLHHALLQTDLDFFVLFSSNASTLGSLGQTNYAAGNAFLDSLAQYRRSLGLPVLCLNWGPWSQIGMAIELERSGRLANTGVVPIPPSDGITALEHLVQKQCTRAAVMNVNWKTWVQFLPELATVPFFSSLQGEMQLSNGPRLETSLSIRLRGLSRDESLAVLESELRDDVGGVLRIPEDRLDRHTSLTRLGLDSLMAVELKNRIDSKAGTSVPVMRLLKGPTLAEMAAMVYELLNLGGTDAYVDALSDAEVEAQLRQLTEQ